MTSPEDFTAPERKAPPHRVEISMPEGRCQVFPADLVGVWHTADTFVLDFSAFIDPPQLIEEDGVEMVQQRAQVVSRVRIPPGQVFEVMKALEQQLSGVGARNRQVETKHGR